MESFWESAHPNGILLADGFRYTRWMGFVLHVTRGKRRKFTQLQLLSGPYKVIGSSSTAALVEVGKSTVIGRGRIEMYLAE